MVLSYCRAGVKRTDLRKLSSLELRRQLASLEIGNTGESGQV